jgi:hypothetical protein
MVIRSALDSPVALFKVPSGEGEHATVKLESLCHVKHWADGVLVKKINDEF